MVSELGLGPGREVQGVELPSSRDPLSWTKVKPEHWIKNRKRDELSGSLQPGTQEVPAAPTTGTSLHHVIVAALSPSQHL